MGEASGEVSSEKVAVVTGVGPGSLGEETAAGLRTLGFRVLTSTRTCASTADQHALELTSRASVHEYADWVLAETDRLDVLVNNAGVHLDLRSAWHEPQLVDGREVHWRTNYLGTAQLTRLLIPLLLDTAREYGDARVVNVVSRLHARGRNEGLDGHLSPYDSWTAYGTSKLALVHEAAEIERRYGRRGLHGYSVHPGAAGPTPPDEDEAPEHRGLAAGLTAGLAAGLTQGLSQTPVAGRLRRLKAPLDRLVPHHADPTAIGGAASTVWCATSRYARPGGYHRDRAPLHPSDEAQDDEAGRILWEATSRWVERGR